MESIECGRNEEREGWEGGRYESEVIVGVVDGEGKEWVREKGKYGRGGEWRVSGR